MTTLTAQKRKDFLPQLQIGRFLAASIAVAIAIYRLLEVPSIKLLNGFFKPRPAQLARAEQF